MRLGSRVRHLPPSATVHINDVSNAMIAEGRRVFKWGLGQSPFPVPSCMQEALREAAHRKEYVTAAGLPELRREISRFEGCRPQDVLVGPGSKELFFIMQLCLDDAELLLPVGSWVSYAPQASLLGRETRWIPRASASAIEEACREEPERERLLVLNAPNNPCGHTFSIDELRDIGAAVRQFPGLTVLSDEIYSGLTHNGEHHSVKEFAPAQTVVTNGVSKWLGAGGWRLGYASFPEELAWLRKGMTNVATETFTSVSAPIQVASIEGFRASHHAPGGSIALYLERQRAILTALADVLVQRLRSAGVAVNTPTGAFYLALDFSKWRHRFKVDSDVSEWALREAGVAFLPGHLFGWRPEELMARVSYVNFDGERALQAMEAGATVNDQFLEEFCGETLEAADSLCKQLARL